VSTPRGDHQEKKTTKDLLVWRDSVILDHKREKARRRVPLNVHEVLSNRIAYTLKEAVMDREVRYRIVHQNEGISILYNHVIGMEDQSVSILDKLILYNLVIGIEDEGVEALKWLW
jgi:hypothetical protein